MSSSVETVVFIGASTGGTSAIRTVLERLPADAPPVLVVQHMPRAFTGGFARRLAEACDVDVVEAVNGAPVQRGHVYIAPGGRHLAIARRGRGFGIAIRDGEPVSRHRPSVDVLFESAARVVCGNAIGVMLTGMGKDGASGMLAIRNAGGHTIAQDAASCVVFGMPREAIALGGVVEVLGLAQMAERIIALARPRAAVA